MIKTKVNGYYQEMNEEDLATIVDLMYGNQ